MWNNREQFENTLKNSSLLRHLAPTELEMLLSEIRNTNRNSNISFKIISIDNNYIKIEVKQEKFPARARKGNQKTDKNLYNDQFRYLNKSELTNNAEKIFEKYFSEKKILIECKHVDATMENVDSKWIKMEMIKNELKLKEISIETGIEYTQLSALVAGSRPLSQPMKALFYYYFLYKQSMKSDSNPKRKLLFNKVV